MWSRKQARCVNWAGSQFLLREILEVITKKSQEEMALEPECLVSNPDFSTGQIQSVSWFPQLTHGDNNSTDHIGIVCYNHRAPRQQGSELFLGPDRKAAGWSPGLWGGSIPWHCLPPAPHFLLLKEKYKLMSLSPNEDLLSYWRLVLVTESKNG